MCSNLTPEIESRRVVNIIGSGVLGLTCALELAWEGSYMLTVITADALSASWTSTPPEITQTTQDFASPWAGAYWQSFVPDRDSQTTIDRRIKEWETVSFKELWKISGSESSGVMQIDCHEYFDKELKNEELPWYTDLCPEARRLSTSELASLPRPRQTGISFKTISLNPLIYLTYLHTQLSNLGVRIVHHRLKSLVEAFEGLHSLRVPPADIVINASGLGAASLLGVEDNLVYPIRGQIVCISPPCPIRFATRDRSKQTYIISRPSSDPQQVEEVILGGCYQQGNYDLSIDPELTAHILREAVLTRPDLSSDGTVDGVRVLKEIVGLRPARKTGPRLELENIIIAGRPKHVLHCYGIGSVSPSLCSTVKTGKLVLIPN
ncbi:hypothetical protein CROQUDRAFT_39026 [Cronartium quercuum f. sp. fusiforme G11]|uniref:FAD dependent oxidoreductase domain-containing protein n=1 Tax=Cronartium quercuum f. sp. fusiforme G11 TaxID=708437 RepID=A0A9P6NTF3_9BASI|nr:hypothetical protein CROQUDRAFT_39026 [Cronartium quercuum f. sp. fusiforme G11]